jgi:hypothetical protein
MRLSWTWARRNSTIQAFVSIATRVRRMSRRLAVPKYFATDPMPRTRYVVVAAVAICSRSVLAQPTWSHREYVDAITDDSVRAVSTKTVDGYEFTVYRLGAKGRVWARFRIPESISDVLASQPPVYRIDSRPPEDLALDLRISKYLDRPQIEQQPKWVNFVIWHGDEFFGAPVAGTLASLTDGKRLLFRYYVFTGGSKDVAFSLEGFADALDWLLGRKPPQ